MKQASSNQENVIKRLREKVASLEQSVVNGLQKECIKSQNSKSSLTRGKSNGLSSMRSKNGSQRSADPIGHQNNINMRVKFGQPQSTAQFNKEKLASDRVRCVQLNLKHNQAQKKQRCLPSQNRKKGMKDHSMSISNISQENCLNFNNVLATNSTIAEPSSMRKDDDHDGHDLLMASAMDNVTEANEESPQQHPDILDRNIQ